MTTSRALKIPHKDFFFVNQSIKDKILFKAVVIHSQASNDNIHTYSFLEDGICFISQEDGYCIFFIASENGKLALQILRDVMKFFNLSVSDVLEA
jgi:hypothetical protein